MSTLEALAERLSPAYTLVERATAADGIQAWMAAAATTTTVPPPEAGMVATKRQLEFAQLEVAHDVVAAGAVLGLLLMAQGPERDLNLMPDPTTPVRCLC
jgi:hypothetical protein